MAEHRHRIVLVDDDPGVRELLRIYLSVHGFEIVGEADNGASGVDVVTRTAPSAVIMDWQMPTLDGIDAVRALRQRGYGGGVVMFSSRLGGAAMEEARLAGADAYLEKPADLDEVIKVLTAVLATRQ